MEQVENNTTLKMIVDETEQFAFTFEFKNSNKAFYVGKYDIRTMKSF